MSNLNKELVRGTLSYFRTVPQDEIDSHIKKCFEENNFQTASSRFDNRPFNDVKEKLFKLIMVHEASAMKEELQLRIQYQLTPEGERISAFELIPDSLELKIASEEMLGTIRPTIQSNQMIF